MIGMSYFGSALARGTARNREYMASSPALGQERDTDTNTKTKLIISLKSDIAEIKQNVEDHKQQLDKFHKKLNQVTGGVEGVREACQAELTKLRDEINEESQILTKVVSWYSLIFYHFLRVYYVFTILAYLMTSNT